MRPNEMAASLIKRALRARAFGDLRNLANLLIGLHRWAQAGENGPVQAKATTPVRKDRRKHFLREKWGYVRAALATPALLLAMHSHALAAPPDAPPPVRNTWGEVGLVDMPNARMTDDGMVSFTFSAMENTQRFNFDFQVLPWFEAVFRYGHIAGANHFVDYHRNLGFKIRLFEEGRYMPDVSVGARDIIGTGRQGAEYLVATKAIGTVDVSAGVGWGRLSDEEVATNPLSLVFSSFKTRAPPTVTGGTLAYGQLFHGPKIGMFGGIDWRTPIEGLDVLAEYSSDKYESERQEGVMNARSPFNVAVSYTVLDDLRITAGWLYGTTYGVALTYARDPARPSQAKKVGVPVPDPVIRTDEQQALALNGLLDRARRAEGRPPYLVVNNQDGAQAALEQALMSEARGIHDVEFDGRTLMVTASYFEDAHAQCRNYAQIAAAGRAPVDSIAVMDPDDTSGNVAICGVDRVRGPRVIDASDASSEPNDVDARIRRDVTAQRLDVNALEIGPSELWLYYRNEHYLFETEAVGRIARILMKDAPAHVEIFHLVLVEHGLAIREFQIVRSALERAASTSGQAGGMEDAIALRLPELDQPVLNKGLRDVEPRLTWSISPALRESFFDPKSPLEIQIYASARANLELLPGLDLTGEVDANIYNNFDTSIVSSSQLPHVRSDIGQYLKHGINGIGDLEMDYRQRLAPDIYSEIKVGYLEDMFAGAGGEVLWRPEGQRFAIGADLYEVWQRDFNRLFGVQNYHVLTGHVTFYYNSPWYGLNLNVHGGRYLAGDYGATIELTRKFDTGVEIGAFATFTNVPFSKFGEGSFDKGFILRIPFEWSLPFYTQTTHTTILHSLARDGGQRLYNDDSLYEETRSASYGELFDGLDRVTSP